VSTPLQETDMGRKLAIELLSINSKITGDRNSRQRRDNSKRLGQGSLKRQGKENQAGGIQP